MFKCFWLHAKDVFIVKRLLNTTGPDHVLMNFIFMFRILFSVLNIIWVNYVFSLKAIPLKSSFPVRQFRSVCETLSVSRLPLSLFFVKEGRSVTLKTLYIKKINKLNSWLHIMHIRILLHFPEFFTSSLWAFQFCQLTVLECLSPSIIAGSFMIRTALFRSTMGNIIDKMMIRNCDASYENSLVWSWLDSFHNRVCELMAFIMIMQSKQKPRKRWSRSYITLSE